MNYFDSIPTIFLNLFSGPQLDWDPDIVAALDEDFNFSDPENELDDDFVLHANDAVAPAGDERTGSDVEQGFASDEADWSGDDDDVDADVASEGGQSFLSCENKSRFTQYSMTSAVIRRNEGLTLIDDCFEEVSDICVTP